jgi:homocysteine S-methyltransferase
MRVKLKDVLEQTGHMVIDGSMGTGLELQGCNLKDKLWTAKVLAETPDKVKEVHLEYFRVGADCGITCSYQATIPGLTAHGYSQAEAEEIITRSVKVFLEARDEWFNKEKHETNRAYPLCLAGCGPYGAYLSDGSEYRGHYGVSDQVLRDFHQRRAQLLWKAGADLLLFETQPSLHEVLIEADIAEKLGADYWISFSCQNGKLTNEGDDLTECARILSKGHPHLQMLGVNCTPPKYMTEAIKNLKAGTDLPIAVYPNSGEVYDAKTKTWHGVTDSQKSFGDYAKEWFQAGAAAVGGCCQTSASHIAQVTKIRNAKEGLL